ncbi:MAG: hypothetical protein AAF221_11705 [Pseudomonadota bacterium]
MKIAGNSFAFLTQLGGDSAARGSSAAQERAAKKAAERASRIALVREANQAQVSRLRQDTFEIAGKRGDAQTSNRRDAKPQVREAVGSQDAQTRPEPGQVLNIVI